MSVARDLIQDVNNLPSLPAVYMRVKAVLEHGDCSMLRVAREISCDPGVTTRLLRLVNSAFYGVCGTVESVLDALTLLGTRQIEHLVLTTSVTTAFARVSPALMDMRKFWRESLYRALVARCVARRSGHPDGEGAFVEGLLGDVGHLVMYMQIPAAAERALQRSWETGQPLYCVERELLGFNYADVGAELMAAWNLSRRVEAAVRYHPEPFAAREFAAEAAVLHIATAFSDAAFRSEPIEHWASQVDPVIMGGAGLSDEALVEIKKEADGELETLVQAILPDFHYSGSRAVPRRAAASV